LKGWPGIFIFDSKRPDLNKKATPPPDPEDLGSLSRVKPEGVISDINAEVSSGRSQVSFKARMSTGFSRRRFCNEGDLFLSDAMFKCWNLRLFTRGPGFNSISPESTSNMRTA
jgi:hypothetical protein